MRRSKDHTPSYGLSGIGGERNSLGNENAGVFNISLLTRNALESSRWRELLQDKTFFPKRLV